MKASETLDILKKQIEQFGEQDTVAFTEVGKVVSVCDGVAIAYGLDKVQQGELVRFDCGVEGVASNLEEDGVGIVILGDETKVSEGESVYRTKNILSVPVGYGVLGRVLDARGNPIDGKGPLQDINYQVVERKAPGIIARRSVFRPMQTGIKAIDSLIPIGRGQRELIIGDRQTGKTTIVLDTILNQKHINEKADKKDQIYCIYVSIGQKESSVARLVRRLEEAEALEYSVIVVAGAASPAMMQYLAPYTGCTMGEFFRDNGMHALIAYDDLTKHAIAYREISLLLRKPPGREAYPGDVFYLHSRLLERAAQMSEDMGNGSLTALPVIETQMGDLSSYIPTNVISITDGQIFLESDLFHKGVRPAVNVGLSVSRVGSAAQIKAMRKVSNGIKLGLAQYREMEAFAQFSSDLELSTQKLLANGKRLIELLKQKQHMTYPVEEQVVLIFAGINGFLETLKLQDIQRYQDRLMSYMKSNFQQILQEIRKSENLTDDLSAELRQILQGFTASFTES